MLAWHGPILLACLLGVAECALSVIAAVAFRGHQYGAAFAREDECCPLIMSLMDTHVLTTQVDEVLCFKTFMTAQSCILIAS